MKMMRQAGWFAYCLYGEVWWMGKVRLGRLMKRVKKITARRLNKECEEGEIK